MTETMLSERLRTTRVVQAPRLLSSSSRRFLSRMSSRSWQKDSGIVGLRFVGQNVSYVVSRFLVEGEHVRTASQGLSRR
jgi:hypothetical protein